MGGQQAVEAASIRPRLLARGDRFGRRVVYDPFTGLQFGHACLRVETMSSTQWGSQNTTLQFGHACLRVETTLGAGEMGSGRAASIRPRLLARGDGAIASLIWSPATLQFGHACLRVETLPTGLSRVVARRASIRPRLLARGDGAGTGVSASVAMRFNSATPACAWRLARQERQSPSQAGFNSATPACAWRLLASQTQQTTHFKCGVSSGYKISYTKTRRKNCH